VIARDIWNRARDPHGTLVERYLASRGLTLPKSPVLRYAPLLRHPPDLATTGRRRQGRHRPAEGNSGSNERRCDPTRAHPTGRLVSRW
jgi:hypothetical protein